MGDPKHLRKKYSPPRHPWQRQRMEVEDKLLKEYGLANKKEIWKMNSIMERFKDQAKSLMAKETEQAKKEEAQLITKLVRLNLLPEGSRVQNALALELKDVLQRRLQSLVYTHGLAKSMRQARQFIVHGHIFVGSKKMNAPSYLVAAEEEAQISYAENSSLTNPEHPERIRAQEEVKTQLTMPKPEETQATQAPEAAA